MATQNKTKNNNTRKKNLNIKLVSGVAKADVKQLKVLAALGLRKSKSSVQREDRPIIQGMLRKVSHLVEVTENK